MKLLDARIKHIKRTMNRSEILNELQRCLEKVSDEHHLPTDAWEVWFRGTHLGTIDRKHQSCYAIYSSLNRHCGDCSNFMRALAQFINSTAVVIANEQINKETRWLAGVNKEPEIRSVGVNKHQQKTLWQKIKGWFK